MSSRTEQMVRTYVVEGVWVVDCPTCAHRIDLVESPVIVCGHCEQIISPVFPATRLEIAALLEARPDPSTRNWVLGESIADLRIENAAHRIGAA